MSGEETERSVDELYEILCDPEKLKNYDGIGLLINMSKVEDMGFYNDNIPYDDIKEYLAEERDAFVSKVPKKVMESRGVMWEHVGSTAIAGMPGTIHPDSLILFNTKPIPKEVFSALIERGFTFIGSGPLNVDDIWFVKKISREGSRLDNALFKIHVTPSDLGPSKMLLETRDRCNNNPEDFEDYKNAKVEASKSLAAGCIVGYKVGKGACKLISELAEKYDCQMKAPH